MTASCTEKEPCFQRLASLGSASTSARGLLPLFFFPSESFRLTVK